MQKRITNRKRKGGKNRAVISRNCTEQTSVWLLCKWIQSTKWLTEWLSSLDGKEKFSPSPPACQFSGKSWCMPSLGDRGTSQDVLIQRQTATHTYIHTYGPFRLATWRRYGPEQGLRSAFRTPSEGTQQWAEVGELRWKIIHAAAFWIRSASLTALRGRPAKSKLRHSNLEMTWGRTSVWVASMKKNGQILLKFYQLESTTSVKQDHERMIVGSCILPRAFTLCPMVSTLKGLYRKGNLTKVAH